MMHGREKSDSAIVAVKPTNKAVPTAAEPVEPRAGAKGNARRQSTHRTQGRERVAQALERVRQAARQRKKGKLTALLHHISIDCLRMAFFAQTLTETSLICMSGFIGEHTGRCHHAGHTYRRLMGNSVRWRLRHSRTRSSRERPQLC
jgi:hypothetical protein